MNLKLHTRFPVKFVAEVDTDAVPRIGEALIIEGMRYVVEAVDHIFQNGACVGRDIFVRRSAYLTHAKAAA